MPHLPVLLKEVIEILNPQPNEFFIDGTIGSGGHAAEIFKGISPGGTLLGIDLDEKVIRIAEQKISAISKFILVHGNYAELPEILEKNNLPKADGLLLDLGFSSETLESGRGFTFLKNEPLDMRYDQKRGEPADIVINYRSEKELAEIFWKYGEEKFARRIAKKIVERRSLAPIKTTFALAKTVVDASPRKIFPSRIHPATKVFQALRIYINDELGNLEKALKNIEKTIKPKGRVAIISFHSLEDRLVKNAFRELKSQGKAQILTKKPIISSKEEIISNPRSRSAKLRAIELF